MLSSGAGLPSYCTAWPCLQARQYKQRVLLVLTSGVDLERGGISQYGGWCGPWLFDGLAGMSTIMLILEPPPPQQAPPSAPSPCPSNLHGSHVAAPTVRWHNQSGTASDFFRDDTYKVGGLWVCGCTKACRWSFTDPCYSPASSTVLHRLRLSSQPLAPQLLPVGHKHPPSLPPPPHPQPQARFFDYLTFMATRLNAHTGLSYRHDPGILGWDLGEGLADGGGRAGDDLQVGREGHARVNYHPWCSCTALGQRVQRQARMGASGLL